MFLKSIKRCCKIWGSLSRISAKTDLWPEVIHCQETSQEFKCFHWIKLKTKALKKNHEKSSSGLSTASRQILYHAFIVFPLFYGRKQNLLIGGYNWSHLMLNIFGAQVISDNSAVVCADLSQTSLIFPSLSIKFTVLLLLLTRSPVALTQISLAKLKVISLSLRVIFFTNILSITQTSSVKVLNGRS